MNLEEAKSKIETTPEERKAIDDYINMYHARINSVMEFDVRRYVETMDYFDLPGKNSNEEKAVKDVLSVMKQIGLVYSGMLKNFTYPPRRLVRGTSIKEASKLNYSSTYNKFVSTTTDREKAMSFCRAGESALLEIEANTPCLDVTEFTGEENLNRDEHEFVLMPFSQVKEVKSQGRRGAYDIYSVKLGEPHLRPFKEGEKEKFEEEIKAKFVSILKIGREYANLRDRINARMVSFGGPEYKRCQELQKEIEPFEQIMSQYAQGICYEKEKEYEEAHRVIDENRRKEQAELNAKRQQEADAKEKRELEEQTARFAATTSKTNEALGKTAEMYRTSYSKMAEEEQKYARIAQKLGIPFNMRIGSTERSVQEIEDNISAMKSQIADMAENSLNNSGNAKESADKADAYGQVASSANSKQTELYEILKEYSAESRSNIEIGVNARIQNTIKNVKMGIINRKKQELQNRKISFFGKLRGLEKLRNIEIDNLELEERLIRSTPMVEKTNIPDMLADLEYFSMAELGGASTKEMMDIKRSVMSVFNVNEATVRARAEQKMKSLPMVIDPKRRMSTSKKIKNAERRKEDLQGTLQDLKQNSFGYVQQPNNMQRPKNNAIEKFTKLIEKVAKDTRVDQKNDRTVADRNVTVQLPKATKDFSDPHGDR